MAWKDEIPCAAWWNARTCGLQITDSIDVAVRVRMASTESGQRNGLESSALLGGGQEERVVKQLSCGGLSQRSKMASYSGTYEDVGQSWDAQCDAVKAVPSSCADGVDIRERAGRSQGNRGSTTECRAPKRRWSDSSHVVVFWRRLRGKPE